MPTYFKARSTTKRANALLSKGDYCGAKALYLELEKMHMVNFMIYHNIASIYFQEHDWIKAQEYFLKAIQLNSESAVSYSSLSEAYLRLRRWKDAEAAMEKALAADPVNYFLEKRLEKVKDNKWRERHVDSLDMTDEGLALLKEKKNDEALNRFERSVQLEETNATAHYLCGTMYLNKTEYKKAIISFSRAMELEPSNREYAVMMQAAQSKAREALNKEDA